MATSRSLPSARWSLFALLLALILLLAAHGTSAAFAADGLPPGVPVPAWAKGKRVHFDPTEPQNSRLADDELGARAQARAGAGAGAGVGAGAGAVAGGAAAALSAGVRPLTSSPSRLTYHGGTIQNEPHLMLVFLGEEWEHGSDLTLRHKLETTAEDLTGSAYEEILTQYSGLDGPISQPLAGSPVIEKYYVKQPITTRIDSYAAMQAGEKAINQTEGWERTDTTYMVVPAPGTVEAEARTCGFHEEYGSGKAGPSIAVVMDPEERIGCNTTKTLTHEYAESVTDADGASGWNTGEGVGGDEIGDICNGLSSGRLGGVEVAYLWDDSKDACEVEDSDPGPALPIGPYAETSYEEQGATNLTPESEKIETSIHPCDLQAHYYFEYGRSEAYGAKTVEASVPAAWGAVKVSATITGLQHSIPYHWRVVVKTSNGSANGVDREFTTPYYAEIKEEGTSNVGLTEATLDGEVRPVGVETKYYFEYGTTTAYGSRTPEASAGSGDEFVKISAPLAGLAPGTSYHYRLVVTNGRGTTIGKDKEFETLGGKPIVFSEPIYTRGYTSATLKSGVYGKGETTKYYFEYGTTEAYGQRTAEQEVAGVRGEEEKEAISGLTPGTRYYYRIVASNSYGTSYGAEEWFSTPYEPLAETGAPEAVGYDDATLNGTIDPNGTKTSYYFEYGASQSYGARTAEVAAGSRTGNVQAVQTLDYLAENTTYHFRVVAKTEYGTTYGADRTFSTGVAPSVQTNSPADVGTEEATFSGTVNPHGTNVAYYFEYGLTSGYGTNTAQVSAGSGNGDVEADQSVTGLAPSTTYHYRLVGVDGSAKQYSSEMTFTTMARALLVEPIGPAPPVAPLAPPVKIAGPTPPPTPVSPVHEGLALQVSQHGSSLLVMLGLDAPAVRVEVDAAVPGGQLGVSKRKGSLLSLVVLARAKRSKVEAGQLKFVLALDAKGARVLKHRKHLTLTITVTVTPSSGEQQRITRTLAIVAR
ncbi:MAG TPA: fibronectin type III domain-containing protein [Solirubrobacteraceae bacterium]